MTKRVHKHRRELCFLGTCKNKAARNRFIKQAPSPVIQSVGDVAKTLLYGELPIKLSDRKKLRKRKSYLLKLASKGNINRKRKLLSGQVGGNILGTIWNVIKEIF